ncbi:hypothetical protein SADUNF_Sadunf11G0096600 [Salix dunnii]|uniref:Thioredoxin domain-containing protein n=1 Tax=Salix dunnii TaxID=1413687 RepID=A0A835JTZ0_9ROSI|nr:hypothetical protein SADUNF_Sadunf11G0096600 [Salix dunnii]
MAGHAKAKKSRVVRIDSEESWDFFIKQATDKDCPVVVHFTASWCTPSVVMNSFFEEIALSYKDLLFLSVDVDEVQGVGTRMKITAMPTFLLMRGGAEVDKLVGANPGETRKRIGDFVHTIRRCKAASSAVPL